MGVYTHDPGGERFACFEQLDLLRFRLTMSPYFCNYRNMRAVQLKKSAEQVAKYADMFSAMGTESRLRIMQLLLSAHPDGLVVGEIQEELDIPSSTLSHHLDKLKAEDLVRVERRHVSPLHRGHEHVAGTAPVSLCRMLYSQPSGEGRKHNSNLQIEGHHERRKLRYRQQH
jgi:DNA-binding transcriptional ArsR family regulator